MYRRIMVPLDGSDLAELALPHAEDLARKELSELDLIMVVEQFEAPVHGGLYLMRRLLSRFSTIKRRQRRII